MRTDPDLIRRLAAELDDGLHGARFLDAGLLDEGRPAFAFSRRPELLVLDLFAPTPVVFFEPAALAIGTDPGYMRAIASALRGMRVDRVAAWPGERIFTLDLVARSRFGVPDGYRLVVELVPRFGNLVLLKGETIVAAAKQFGLAENEARAILVGGRYAPPPLRPSRAGAAPSAPAVPPEASVLDAMRADAKRRRDEDARGTWNRLRTATARRIERRTAQLQAERDRLVARRDDREHRDRLRAAGEALYTYASVVPPGASRFVPPSDPSLEIELDPQLDAKANAAAIFARYRKLGKSLPHVERRLAAVESQLLALEELAWQLESGDAAIVGDVTAALDQLDGPRAEPPAKAQRRRREPLRFALPSGARLYVGRSPEENADVTFRIARPFDLWFHARETPGAHVILAADGDVRDEDVESAAAVAAFFSKARESERVAIDYVARKYVRKQRHAPPGRVWYTNAQTLFVRARNPETTFAPPRDTSAPLPRNARTRG